MQRNITLHRTLLRLMLVLTISALACNLPFSAAEHTGSSVVPGPAVSLQNPAPGDEYSVGDSVPIFVSAADPAGVLRIDVWVNGTLLLSQAAPQEQPQGITPLILTQSFKVTSPGNLSVSARAYNSNGAAGESLTSQIIVVEDSDTTLRDLPIMYMPRSEETIDDLAREMGYSVEELREENPGILNILGGGPVALPGPPQAQSRLPVLAGEQIIPGVEVFQQGAVEQIAPGQIAQLPPVVAPVFQPPGNQLNHSLSAPVSLSGSTSSCQVSLTWIDTSSSESAYHILRQRIPEQPAPVFITSLPPNHTSYTDDVPGPGQYQYFVEAVGDIQIQSQEDLFMPQETMAGSRSAPFRLTVPASADCIRNPDKMLYAHIQILDVTLKHDRTTGLSGAALWYSINSSPSRRLPQDQGQYFPSGSWPRQVEVVPVSPSLLLNPEHNYLLVHFWVTAMATDRTSAPEDLGESFGALEASTILTKTDNYYIAENASYIVYYRVWIEEQQWTGQGTSAALPAPANLRVLESSTTARTLTWDWAGSPDAVDGFLLYRSYSCPGSDSELYVPQMMPFSPQQAVVKLKSEPVGCVYRYQVSAFGRAGESAPSNSLTGETQSSYGIAGIRFDSITFNGLPDNTAAQLQLFVNQHQRTSAAYLLDPGSYALADWVIGSRRPNHALSLPLGEKEFLTIGFSVGEVDDQGVVSPASICRGAVILPPLSIWNQPDWSTTITSSDGTCQVAVSLDSQPPLPAPSGGIVLPQADIKFGKIAHFGNQVFAYLINSGPDDLPNNSLILTYHAANLCPDTQLSRIDFNEVRPIRIQSSLPQWVYLSLGVDALYIDSITDPDWSGSIGNCQFGFFVSYAHPEGPDGQPDPNFVDPDPDDNVLFIAMDQIPPMD